MGYKAGDLRDLVKPIFEIDSYKSKMGDDQDIVVVSFTVNEDQAASDLVDFIEKGYDFVLDADSTSGEIEDGIYRVFVEIERNKDVSNNIMELLDGVGKLSELNEFRFRYYKSFRSKVADLNSLMDSIPISSNTYFAAIQENRMNNYKNFFDRSFVDSIEMYENDLIVKKIYADPIGFMVKDFGPSEEIFESIQQKINMNDYAEILFLTKYLGDYNVTKFGHKTLTLENAGHTLVLERL
jgi:hypothetical protein|tara:strand:+ start:822 stop:1538 length:717 start_codon:yes stop_codon:yes gene_type:complete